MGSATLRAQVPFLKTYWMLIATSRRPFTSQQMLTGQLGRHRELHMLVLADGPASPIALRTILASQIGQRLTTQLLDVFRSLKTGVGM
jgi:hypothetical protein